MNMDTCLQFLRSLHSPTNSEWSPIGVRPNYLDSNQTHSDSNLAGSPAIFWIWVQPESELSPSNLIGLLGLWVVIKYTQSLIRLQMIFAWDMIKQIQNTILIISHPKIICFGCSWTCLEANKWMQVLGVQSLMSDHFTRTLIRLWSDYVAQKCVFYITYYAYNIQKYIKHLAQVVRAPKDLLI